MGYPMAFSAMQKCRQRGQKHLSTIAATSIVAGGSLLPIFPAAATTTCTAADLDELRTHALDIDCDIINVTQNISFSEGNHGIVLTHDAVIQGSITIDANSYGEIFLITQEYDGTVYAGDINNNGQLDVTFKNLTLREGSASDQSYFSYGANGGAITQPESALPISLKLDSVDFIDNIADAAGGAVFIREGFIEVTNGSTFTNNEAGSGGAIHITDGTQPNSNLPIYFPTDQTSGLLISGSAVFHGNAASVYGGGAIFAQTGVAISGDVSFVQNVANREGGAISGITTTITNTADVIFDNNYAGVYGGAIGFNVGNGFIPYQSLVWIEGDATFSDNQAGIGGAAAVWALFAVADSNVTFERNEATVGNGGAVAAFGVVFGVYRELDRGFEATAVFNDNSAGQDGGAIWANVVFSDKDNALSFTGNQSGDDGGAISTYGFGAPYQLSNAYFGQNVAGDNGGAIYSTQRLLVENSTFYANTAGNEGGAIFANGDNSQAILSTFVNNQANGVGPEIPGQSIYTGSSFKLFGNIFANQTSNQAQLGEGRIGDGNPELIDLGGNLSTSAADGIELVHPTSQIVNYAELTLAAAPSVDPEYPTTAKTIQISTDSAAADILNLAELEESIAQLILTENQLPTRDQRGVTRALRYDAGAYEAGENTYRSITPIIEVLPKVILPTAPTQITVKRAGKAALRIEWPLPKSAGSGKITGYEIYRNGQKIATVSSSTRSYRDAGLEVNQSYTYRIVTIATQGKSIKSVNSQSVFPKMKFRVK